MNDAWQREYESLRRRARDCDALGTSVGLEPHRLDALLDEVERLRQERDATQNTFTKMEAALRARNVEARRLRQERDALASALTRANAVLTGLGFRGIVPDQETPR